MNDFKTELGYITNERYRKSIETILSLLPDYFFHVPSSSTGKHHPSFALGEKGLVRHTKVAVRIAKELLGLNMNKDKFTGDERDLIISALIIHDGLKSGLIKQEYTVFDHPLLISKFISDNASKLLFNSQELSLLKGMLESHMGQWNKNDYSTIILPLPSNKCEEFIHMCDYLASRKFLDVKFNNNEIEE